MPSQIIGLIEIDEEVADFEWQSYQRRLAFNVSRQRGWIARPTPTDEIEADQTVLNAELDVEYTRLLQRMWAE